MRGKSKWVQNFRSCILSSFVSCWWNIWSSGRATRLMTTHGCPRKTLAWLLSKNTKRRSWRQWQCVSYLDFLTIWCISFVYFRQRSAANRIWAWIHSQENQERNWRRRKLNVRDGMVRNRRDGCRFKQRGSHQVSQAHPRILRKRAVLEGRRRQWQCESCDPGIILMNQRSRMIFTFVSS